MPVSENTRELLSLYRETLLMIRSAQIEEGVADKTIVKQNTQLLWALTKVPEDNISQLAEAVFSAKDLHTWAEAEQALFTS